MSQPSSASPSSLACFRLSLILKHHLYDTIVPYFAAFLICHMHLTVVPHSTLAVAKVGNDPSYPLWHLVLTLKPYMYRQIQNLWTPYWNRESIENELWP